MSTKLFMERFRFDETRTRNLGVEQELFVTDSSGSLVPVAAQVLADWNGRESHGLVSRDSFGYELSACQLETRTGPCTQPELRAALVNTNAEMEGLLAHHGLIAFRTEVGPATMPLAIYPDPRGRYQRITEHMSRDVLLAACRVIGTHVHVGMRDHNMALRVYNYAIRYVDELCSLGDGSGGERLAIYRQMASRYMPEPYPDWDAFYAAALLHGFAKDPRSCWTLIRISVHGTIEFRMFGTTGMTDRVASWADRCLEICDEALAVE